MLGRILIFAFLVAVRASAAETAQTPLTFSPLWTEDSFQSDTYKFEWPIHKIAIVGAGPGGLIAYREFSQAGYDVHVFERDDSPGGNWHYSDETPPESPVPNVDISVADFEPSLPPKGAKLPYIEEYRSVKIGEKLQKAHRSPRPIWASLKSNSPAPIMQITEFPWPSGTPWEIPQQKLQSYLRAFASWHGINANDGSPHVSYNTRVESVQKRYAEDGSRIGWTLTVKEVLKTSYNTTRAKWTTQDFDAVVVATGRCNAPNMPNIEGLSEWTKRFPDRIIHSRQYRRPEPYSNQTVLVVGAKDSGVEISRDIISHVRQVYQSIRPKKTPDPSSYTIYRLPPNVTVISEIKRFLPIIGSKFNEGKVELVNGTIISGIDHIIFATGYRYTFPFLQQYFNSSIGMNDTVPRGMPQPLITDGSHIRSLYLDAFYIDDPTLTFLNLNNGVQVFVYTEFLALAIAKVWAGKADLPGTTELWRRYDETVGYRGGFGKNLQFFTPEDYEHAMRYFQAWLNADAFKYGGRQINSIPDTSEVRQIWTKARYSSGVDNHIGVLVDGTESWAQKIVFSNNW